LDFLYMSRKPAGDNPINCLSCSLGKKNQD
jgi:hypothetical protein